MARFNDFARTGHDEEFSRGASAYDRYYGDRRCRPNPNLAPLAKAPFYAARIVPGDLGQGRPAHRRAGAGNPLTSGNCHNISSWPGPVRRPGILVIDASLEYPAIAFRIG